MKRPCRILLIEDNPADVRLLEEALKESPEPYQLYTVFDGEAAMDFIHRRSEHSDKPRPDLILLDINIPKVNGHAVLESLKNSSDLRRIPVVMLTSSDSPVDVLKAYDHHANAYIKKPGEISEYFKVVSEMKRFWLNVVALPAATAR